MQENPPLHVVAAIIVADSKVLACRRASHKAAAGLWEFPGGKVDPGEDAHAALIREIKEELALDCETIHTFDVSDTLVGTQIIRLETIICKIGRIPHSAAQTMMISFGSPKVIFRRWIGLNQTYQRSQSLL